MAESEQHRVLRAQARLRLNLRTISSQLRPPESIKRPSPVCSRAARDLPTLVKSMLKCIACFQTTQMFHEPAERRHSALPKSQRGLTRPPISRSIHARVRLEI